MWSAFDVAVFAAGFAACWFGKDYIVAAIAKVKGVVVKVKADL
jgi:hypothetical protein